jgi:hypothetical protein
MVEAHVAVTRRDGLIYGSLQFVLPVLSIGHSAHEPWCITGLMVSVSAG